MTLLRPHHFQTPPKPKEEDFKTNSVGNFTDRTIELEFKGDYWYNKTSFDRVIANWNQHYGPEPVPEWVSFKDKEPDTSEGKQFYMSSGKPSNPRNSGICLTRYTIPDGLFDEFKVYWADKSTFDTLHQTWKDHQVRYKGWEIDYDNVFVLYDNQTPIAKVNFREFGSALYVWLLKKGNWWHMLYSGSTPSTNLFEMILKENGIEL